MAAVPSLPARSDLAAPSRTVAQSATSHASGRTQIVSFAGLRRQAGTLSAGSSGKLQWAGRVNSSSGRRSCGTVQPIRANWNQEVVWADAPVVSSEPAADQLVAVTLDVSHLPEIQSGYTTPGQFVQVTVGDAKPAFLAIASAPEVARSAGRLEFLIKAVEGSTAALVAAVKAGGQVAVSPVMGKGFNVAAVPAGDVPSLLLFATGSGISPIRALIEHGFDAKERSDVRLYFGVRNAEFMPYQDRIAAWEASGVKVIPVFSNPQDGWAGETGFVQAAYERAQPLADGSKAGAVLCGHKGMAQDVTSILTSQGVAKEKILLNF